MSDHQGWLGAAVDLSNELRALWDGPYGALVVDAADTIDELAGDLVGARHHGDLLAVRVKELVDQLDVLRSAGEAMATALADEHAVSAETGCWKCDVLHAWKAAGGRIIDPNDGSDL